MGLSTNGYAKLLADTHRALGHGPLSSGQARAAIRESSTDAPGHTIQLTIAHIHRIPPHLLSALGWPDFLRLATAETTSWDTDAPARPPGFPSSPADRSPEPRPTVTGQALAAFIRRALATVASSRPRAQSGAPLHPGTVAMLESRAIGPDEVRQLAPTALLAFATTDLRLLTATLADSAYDTGTSSRLLHLTADLAGLCGVVHSTLGDTAQAERYLLAAVQASSTAGGPVHAAVSLCVLAIQHNNNGAPLDALTLIEAARSINPNATQQAALLLHTQEARARAGMLDSTASFRALDRAFDNLTEAPCEDSPILSVADECPLSITAGTVWLRLGKPRQALKHLERLSDGALSHLNPSSIFITRALVYTTDAYMALNDIDSAVHIAHRIADLNPHMPASLIRRFHKQFRHHWSAPAVRNLFERLTPASV
ncbi:hypothetical protein [Kitasatospora sp. NPDC089509]|uniref:hypothetical protein n=1 Tax=Kitasatospora sp. NPDC089509 TaxID=3364079 RepID=UPI0037FF5358